LEYSHNYAVASWVNGRLPKAHTNSLRRGTQVNACKHICTVCQQHLQETRVEEAQEVSYF